MAAADLRIDDALSIATDEMGESAIVRQMAEFADAISRDDLVSASAVRDVASCLEMLSRLWGPSAPNARVGQAVPDEESKRQAQPDLPFGPAEEDGRFEVIRLLGHGGFGVVLLAMDRRLGREVALKIPRPEILVSRGMRQRFVREAQVAAALDHPNIVPIFDTGEIGPVWFITSRYVAGPTLAEWIREADSPLSCRDIAQLAAKLADAVHHAHSRGVLHRDLKPANVLLEPAEHDQSSAFPFVPKLSDFGLAKHLEEDDGCTRIGALIGTPRYMAPEQAAGRYKEIGIRTDVYGLGVILYELLAGKPPHVGESDLETLRQVENETPPRETLNQRRVPLDLQTICLKCLEKAPANRYETAGELAADLRRFLNGEPVAARPIGRTARLIRWCRRRPAHAAFSAAVMLLSIAGVAGITWQGIRAERNLAIAEREAKRAEDNLRQMELAYIDLAWMFEEADLWSRSDAAFPPLLRAKLRQYAEEMLPQYEAGSYASPTMLAAFYSLAAKSQSLEGDFTRAEANYRKSIELWCTLLSQRPQTTEYLRPLGITLYGYAAHLATSGRIPAETPAFQATQKMFEEVQLRAENELIAREQYAQLMTNLAHARAISGRNVDAILAFDLASQMWHDLASRSGRARFLIREAASLRALSARRRQAGDLRGALANSQRATRSAEQALVNEPSNYDFLVELAHSLRSEAYLTNRNQRPSRAVPIYERSIALFEQCVRDQPTDFNLLEALGATYFELARILLDAKGHLAALPRYKKGVEIWEGLQLAGRLPSERQTKFAFAYLRLGETHDRLRQDDDAIEAYRNCIQLARILRDRVRRKHLLSPALVDALIQLGDVLERQSNVTEATECRRDAVELLEELTRMNPDSLRFKRQLQAVNTKLLTHSNADSQ